MLSFKNATHFKMGTLKILEFYSRDPKIGQYEKDHSANSLLSTVKCSEITLKKTRKKIKLI